MIADIHARTSTDDSDRNEDCSASPTPSIRVS
jgi:hypothetical protein